MKQIFIFLFFFIALNSSYGQACGVYRIKYIGKIVSPNKKIKKVYLPTTYLLEGYLKRRHKEAFIETTSINGNINQGLESGLGRVYIDTNELLTFYKRECKSFNLKVIFYKNSIRKKKIISIDWNDIEVSFVKEGEGDDEIYFFLFNLKTIFL